MKRATFSIMHLIVLALAFFVVFSAARVARDRLSVKFSDAKQAMIAVNYALSSIRGNDAVGRINVRSLPNTTVAGEKTALVTYFEQDGAMMAEWLFFADGYLRAYKTTVDDLAFSDTDGVIVTPVRGFSVAQNGATVHINAEYTIDGDIYSEEVTFSPRTTVN